MKRVRLTTTWQRLFGSAPVGVLSLLLVSILVSACQGAALRISQDRVVADAALADRIDSAIGGALEGVQLAGLSIAVARGGEVAFASGYGYSDLPAHRPAGAHTVYPIGSISKQFTAAAIIRLVEDGLLSLEDPVSAYVEVPEANPAPTVGQLLSHTAGFTDRQLGPVLAATSDGMGLTVDEVMDLVTAPGYQYPPGSGFEYINGGYLLAYRVIEAVSRQSYDEHLSNALLDPVGLEESFMCPSAQPAAWAQGYLPLEGRWARTARLGRPPGLIEAGPSNMAIVNSVCSTAVDLVRWAHSLRNGKVVSPDHYQMMSSATRLGDGTVVPYGLGLQRRQFGDHYAVAHGGIVGGFVGNLADFPEDDVTVGLLVNTYLSEAQAGRLLTGILAAVFDEPASEWSEDTTYLAEEK